MAVLEVKNEIVKEFIERLEKQGHSQEYVDGALEGMSFVLEFYQSMVKLSKMKKKLLEDANGTTEISS